MEPQPNWQSRVGAIKAHCAQRAVADVAAVADPDTGVAVYDTFELPGWTVFGGTSVSTQIIAAVFALAVRSGDSTASGLYGASPDDFYDVTTGSNGTCGSDLCTAEVGWDAPTGQGPSELVSRDRAGRADRAPGQALNAPRCSRSGHARERGSRTSLDDAVPVGGGPGARVLQERPGPVEVTGAGANGEHPSPFQLCVRGEVLHLTAAGERAGLGEVRLGLVVAAENRGQTAEGRRHGEEPERADERDLLVIGGEQVVKLLSRPHGA